MTERCFTIKGVPNKVLWFSYYVRGRNEDNVILKVIILMPLTLKIKNEDQIITHAPSRETAVSEPFRGTHPIAACFQA